MAFKKVALPSLTVAAKPGIAPGLSASTNPKFKRVDLGYKISYAPSPTPKALVKAVPAVKVNTPSPGSGGRGTINRGVVSLDAMISADQRTIKVPDIGFGNTPEADAAYRASIKSGVTKIEPERRTNFVKGIASGVVGLKAIPASVVAGVARGSEIGMGKIVKKESPTSGLFGNTPEYEEAYKNWVASTGGPTVTDKDRGDYLKAATAAVNADQRMLRVVAIVDKQLQANPNLYLPETDKDGKVSKVNQFVYELGNGAVSEIAAMTISALSGGTLAGVVAPLFGLWSFGSKYAEAVGAGVDVEKAYNSATISGLVNWIGEYAQLKMFGTGKNVLTSAGDEVQSSLNNALKDVALKNQSQVMARVAQLTSSIKKVETAAGKLAFKNTIGGIINDVIENAAQEFMESAGESIADFTSGVKQLTPEAFWQATANAFKSAAYGGILSGTTSIAIGNATLNVDRANFARVQETISEVKSSLDSKLQTMRIEVKKLNSALPTTTMGELQLGRGVVNTRNMTASGFKTLLETSDALAIFSVERSGQEEVLNNWGRTQEVSRIFGGVHPVLGTYEGMDGSIVHEHSFITTNLESAMALSVAAGQESVLIKYQNAWYFVDPRTGEKLGTASEINYAPIGAQTQVSLAGKKGLKFGFNNVQWGIETEETPPLVSVIDNKSEKEFVDTLSAAGMGYNEQGQAVYYSGPDTATSGTSENVGMESVGTAQMPIGNYDKTIQQGTSNFTSTTTGNTTESTVRVADKVINWRSSVVKGGTVEVIQTTVSDKGEKVDNTPQLLKNIQDIKSGNFVITANGADAQFLSGIEFTQAGVRGAWAQGSDISNLLNTGKTHIILIYELAGRETPRGHITYPSLINNPTYIALLEAYAPETMAKLRAEAARRQVAVDSFNEEMAPILAIVGKNEKLNSEALARWNATHPDARPLSKLKLKDDVFWYNTATVKEESELNKYAVLMTTPHNRDAHDRVVGAFILNGCYQKDNFIFPREVQTIVNTYNIIDWGTALVFKKPVTEQFVRSKLVSSVVEVTGQKKSLFDFSKTAQKQSYVPSAKEMGPVVDEILSSLEEFVGTEKETGQSTLTSSADIDAPMELERYGVERLPQQNLDMIQAALEKYHQSRAANVSGTNGASTPTAVSNYQTQYGGQQYNGTGATPIIMTVSPGGNPVLINQQGQPVAVLPTLLKTKPIGNIGTQDALSLAEEHWKDDINVLRKLGFLDGFTYKLLTVIRGSSTATEFAALHGLALLPDGKKQVFAPGVQLTPFTQLGDKLKRAGMTEEDLNRFAILYAGLKGNPVNVESMPEVNLLKQGKGTLQEKLTKVHDKALVALSAYTPEQYALLKGVMDEAHKYLTPIVNVMHSRGMPLGDNLDSGAINVDDWIDSYVSSAEPNSSGNYRSSSPMEEKQVETISHKQVTGYLNGIVNTMNHYNQWFMYNEYVKRLSAEMGYTSEKEINGAPTFYADDGTVRWVDAPEHIKRQITSVISRTNATSKFFNTDIYNKLMTASRELKLMTPAFAQTNLFRDASLVLTRYGLHPVAAANTILKLIIGQSEKSSGLVGMGTPNELTGNVFTDFQNIDHAIALTHTQRILQYIHDNILGVSESLMRNYAFNVEKGAGKSEVEQIYALIASSADFTVYGSSESAANIRKAWQFSQASLDVSMSWDLAIKELGAKMASDNMGTKFEGFSGAALLIAFIAAGIAFKAREKERKELQDYVSQNKIPVRIGKNIITIPEGFNQGAMLENTISTIVAGIMSGDTVGEITGGLAQDVYSGIVGMIGRDGDLTLNSIASTLTPTLFEPITRVFLNTQYGGGQIDPMTWGANWTHYFKSTTRVAKYLTRQVHDLTNGAVDLSPIKMDYLIKSYLARYGTALTKMDSTGFKSAVSGFLAQQFVVPVPQGIKTQAYSDWQDGYARIADELAQAKKGNYPMSQNMVNDFQLLTSINNQFPKQQTAQGVYALSLYGLIVLDAYYQHKKERK